jgi:RND family efflux transporter MFP subunit
MRIRLGTRLSRAAGSAIAATTAGAAIAAIALTGCASHAAPAQHGPPPASVATAKVTRGNIATYAVFDGQITPVFQTTLSTAEAGTIAAVNVTEGDFVQRGQILASLDTSQLQASLKANEAMVRQDEAQLTHSNVAAPVNSQQYTSAVSTAQQNLQAAVNNVRAAKAALVSDDLTQKADAELLKQEYVSRQTYEQARAAYVAAGETLRSDQQAVIAEQAALQTAQTNTHQRQEDQATIAQNQGALDEARANVELLEAQIAQSSIVAPFDGQVTQRLLDPGAYAGANSGILTLSQVSRVYVVANVPDVDLPYVKVGKAVTFTTTSLGSRTFHGNVFDVNTTPTSGTLSYRVRLLQPNPDLTLRGGMLVSVTTVRERHVNALIVPSQAVFSTPKGTVVYTVVAAKAHAIPVRVGIQTDSRSEVTGNGLEPGATVITSQPMGLQDGSPVVVPASSPPAGGSKGAGGH